MKKPPCLLISGWGMYSGLLNTIAIPLQQFFTVKCYDLPGVGNNRVQLSPYNLTNIVKDVLTHLTEPTVLCGWSLGGLVALACALQQPTLVKRLVFLASTPCFINQENWPGIELSVLEKFYDTLLNQYELTLRNFLVLQTRSCPEVLNQIREELKVVPPPEPTALTGGLNILKTIDLRQALKDLALPHLFIFGGRDAIVPIAVAASLAEQLSSQGKIVTLADAGHIPFITHPQEVIQLILAGE